MKTKLLLCLLTVSLAIANAASFNLTLSSPMWAGATELKPGDYKLTLEGDKLVFARGKKKLEAPVTTATAEKKYSETSFLSADSKIKEIDLKGTTTKVFFSPSTASK